MSKFKIVRKAAVPVAAIGAAVFATGCAKTSSSANLDLGAALTSLTKLPSVSSMVATSSSQLSSPAVEAALSGRIASSASVTGTPPLLTALSSFSAIDTYFYDGVVQQIIDAGGSASPTLIARFFGTTAGGPGGQGACNMAQSVGENIGRLLQNGTSSCYMKHLPAAATGVTISGAGATAENIMAQGAADKIVNVQVHNLVNGGGDPTPHNMNVYLRIYGTDTVGSSMYKVKLWFCQEGSATVNQEEIIQANTSTGEFLNTNSQSQGSSSFQSRVSAFLTLSPASGSIVFDATRDRTASFAYHDSTNDFKGEMTVGSSSGTDLIHAKSLGNSTWGANKNYTIAAFSGSGLSSLRFLEGAFKGVSTWGTGGAAEDHTYSGATEFNGSYYASVASSSLLTEVQAMDFATDTFYTDLSMESFSSAESCSPTVDATLTADFSTTGSGSVGEIHDNCEADRFDNYNMCNSDEVRTAMSHVFMGL